MPVYKKNSYVKKTPFGYKDLEYIESTGSQHIATGVYLTKTGLSANLQYTITGSASDQAMFGLHYDSAGSYSYRCGTHNNNFTTTTDSSGITTASGATTSQTNSKYQFIIFAKQRYDDGEVDSNATGQLYNAQIYDNGVLIRDFIPALRTNDNVAGLYDLVNDTFYPSSSSTAFVAGEELTDCYELKPAIHIPSGIKEVTNIQLNQEMTSNTAPSGVCSGSSLGEGNYYQAFTYSDISNSSKWSSAGGSYSNAWLKYEFPQEVKVTSFEFCNPSDASYGTSSQLKLQASNDDSSWTDLWSGTITTVGSVVTTNITNTNYYKYYRLVFVTYNNTYGSKTARCSYLKYIGDMMKEVEYKLSKIMYGAPIIEGEEIVDKIIWENINIDFTQEGGTGTITANRDIKGILVCSAYRNTRGGGSNPDCSITATSTGSKCVELSNDTWYQNKWDDGAGWWYGGKGNLRIYLVECKAGDTFTITSSYSGSATLINCGKSNAEVIPYSGGAQANFKHGIVIGVGHRGYGSSAVNISMSNGTCKSYEEISSTANGTGKRLIAKVSGSVGDTINFSVTSANYANGMMKLINIK